MSEDLLLNIVQQLSELVHLHPDDDGMVQPGGARSAGWVRPS
ncbi:MULTISPECIES: hypothetical protein [unclassified Streptomyces]